MSNSSDPSGVKRKRDDGKPAKFYGVRIGRQPGVYHSWNDCLKQVEGHKNASYKSFSTLTDAESFAAGKTVASAASTGKKSSKFYAVAQGHQIGIYEDWPSASKQIQGASKPVFKSFPTRAEAETFLKRKNPTAAAKYLESSNGNQVSALDGSKDANGPPKSKKTKATMPSNNSGDAPQPNDPGWDPLPSGAEDGFDSRIKLDDQTGALRYKTPSEQEKLTPQAKVNSKSDVLQVWTDGACRSNGRKGAIAGVGVYFGPDDERNLAEALTGPRQTNQRAELTAIKRAFDLTPFTRSMTIYSDSQYAIKCVTEWFVNWERNNWVNSSKKPVENRDLVEAILKQIRVREQAKAKTEFVWVKGHASDEGNQMADELAVKGAEAARNGSGEVDVDGS